MYDQCNIQIEPESKFLTEDQVDGICFGQLSNKKSALNNNIQITWTFLELQFKIFVEIDALMR